MFKKISSLFLILGSLVIFVPAASAAASSEKTSSVTVNATVPQIRVQIGSGRRHRRWNRDRRWNQGRNYGYGNRGNGRLVRQVYYYHGRQYVRWVRVW